MPDRRSADPPALIAINQDDYHAEHVGRTSDGRQFFLTTPFEPGDSEYVALFTFDRSGQLLHAQIDDLGPRETMDKDRQHSLYEQRLRELGPVSLGRIEVAPFSVERFGTTFGLIPCAPEDEEDDWCVQMHPGNYMSFHEPWDSGEYDT